MNSNELVKKAFECFRANPPDLRQIGAQEGEIRYVQTHLSTYERTISDVLKLFHGYNELSGYSFVELGAFLGIVSKALSLTGATVVACDIPEFFARENVRKFYQDMNVKIESFNLRDYQLPFPSSSQDCVIACEIFEHLNFNPLPIFAEINRILKPGGYFYIAMPNGSYLPRKIKYLVSGNTTPGFTIEQLFAQLNPNDNMVVGLHWREYTLAETIQMISPLGFELIESRTWSNASFPKSLLVRFFPGGGEGLLGIFKKVDEFRGDFYICADS